MSRKDLAIVGAGMVSGVGLNAPASCAAIRCGIDNVQEIGFMDAGGEWFRACSVPLEKPWDETEKVVKMLGRALLECIASYPQARFERIPVIICLSEGSRPGRNPNLDRDVLYYIKQELGELFHDRSTVLAEGKIGAVVALRQVRRMIYEEKLEHVMIVGVDSLISTPVLSVFEEKGRLLTSRNSNGFIPGEAAAAVLISTPKTKSEPELICRGLGFGMESATIDSDLPLRADGLVQALRESMAEAACTMGDLDFCITDASGEQYYFKEASLALLRALRDRKDEFDMWHPADCIGEVGAAIGPVIFAVAMYAMQKGYAPGHHILCHFSNDDGRRAAVILSYQQVEHL